MTPGARADQPLASDTSSREAVTAITTSYRLACDTFPVRTKEIKYFKFNAVLTFEDSHRRENTKPQERTLASRRQRVPPFLSKYASTEAVA